MLAECEAVCPSRLYAPIECGHLAFGYVEDDGVQMEAWFLYVGAATAPMSLYALAGEQVWLAAYYLLGLDKRDALEAHTRKEAEFEARMNLMDAKQEKYMDLYRTEKEKSKRWESRAWKILQIAKDKSMESFAHSIRVAKLEADLAAVGNTEQNTKLKWEQTFKANPWDGVSVCATYMGLDFHIELQDDGKFEMSSMLHGALYGFGKVAIRQRAINQMDKIFNEMLQDPIDVMRIAERYAKD